MKQKLSAFASNFLKTYPIKLEKIRMQTKRSYLHKNYRTSWSVKFTLDVVGEIYGLNVNIFVT